MTSHAQLCSKRFLFRRLSPYAHCFFFVFFLIFAIFSGYFPKLFLLFHKNFHIFSFSQNYHKIPSKTRQALLNIRPYSINYKNFLKTLSTVFKVSTQISLKTLLHFLKPYKLVKIRQNCFRNLIESHPTIKDFQNPQKSKHKTSTSLL